jgi:hypothetical protein
MKTLGRSRSTGDTKIRKQNRTMLKKKMTIPKENTSLGISSKDGAAIGVLGVTTADPDAEEMKTRSKNRKNQNKICTE